MNTVQNPTDAMIASFSAPAFEVNDPWGTNTARGGLDPMDLSNILCKAIPLPSSSLSSLLYQEQQNSLPACFFLLKEAYDNTKGGSEKERKKEREKKRVGVFASNMV